METKDFGKVAVGTAMVDVGENGTFVKGFIDDEGKIWFLAIDLAYQLGYDIPKKAVEQYCKHAVYGKGVVWNLAGDPIVVPEQDMYNLVLHSTDKDCVEFQQSICTELCYRYHSLCGMLYDEYKAY